MTILGSHGDASEYPDLEAPAAASTGPEDVKSWWHCCRRRRWCGRSHGLPQAPKEHEGEARVAIAPTGDPYSPKTPSEPEPELPGTGEVQETENLLTHSPSGGEVSNASCAEEETQDLLRPLPMRSHSTSGSQESMDPLVEEDKSDCLFDALSQEASDSESDSSHDSCMEQAAERERAERQAEEAKRQAEEVKCQAIHEEPCSWLHEAGESPGGGRQLPEFLAPQTLPDQPVSPPPPPPPLRVPVHQQASRPSPPPSPPLPPVFSGAVPIFTGPSGHSEQTARG